MDLSTNLGAKATDTITGITGKISGVFIEVGQQPQYKIEFTDNNGGINTIWRNVGQVDLVVDGE